jgi:hypothetical protein
MLVWHFALYNQQMNSTSAGKAFGFPTLCGLSIAPLCIKRKHENSTK